MSEQKMLPYKPREDCFTGVQKERSGAPLQNTASEGGVTNHPLHTTRWNRSRDEINQTRLKGRARAQARNDGHTVDGPKKGTDNKEILCPVWTKW